MNKKLSYQIEITLCTDGDFSFRKELLPPDFLTDDCREIIEFTEDSFKCNIYEKDMTKYGWKNSEWTKFITRSTFEQYISAIHVSFTHLYIWQDLLRCLEELTSYLYSKELTFDKNEDNEFWSSIYGNYDGTDFIIRRITNTSGERNE